MKSNSLTKAPLIALVGNPNAGKTTLFNTLTGSFQKVGNYPGVTVEKVSGTLKLGSESYECLDVPGLYSLQAVSEDERVAVDVVTGNADSPRPDLLVCVVDVTNLERNLYLFSQLAELGIPTVVALTMSDRLEKSGKSVDLVRLHQELGCEIVSLVGHKDKGIDALQDAIARALVNPSPMHAPILGAADDAALDVLCERLARAGFDYDRATARQAVLNDDPQWKSFLHDFPELAEAFTNARRGLSAPAPTVSDRYAWAARVQADVIRDAGGPPQRSLSDRIDGILTHRMWGLLVFVGIMYVVFQSIYTFSKPIQDGIDRAFKGLSSFVGPHLDGMPAIQSLVTKGLIAGVGGMVAFLPQIVILFFFIAVLEGTGYLARAAFLMDRLLGWCGLNGRAFIPLLSSYACAIPGIMAARVMPDPKSRLATIMVAPLMSCSARLPVYIVVIGALIQPRYGSAWAGFTLFAMHLLGLIVAVPVVYIFNRRVLRGKRLPFLLELPPYQWPKWRDVFLAMYFRAKIFLKTAGTIIVAMSVVIWALTYYPHAGEAEQTTWAQEYRTTHEVADRAAIEQNIAERQMEQSVLGRFGRAIEPAFVPAGFDWRITTSILAAFPARETVVPSMGILFSLGEDVDEKSTDLRTAMSDAKWPDGRPLFTLATSIGLMVFFALCAQCFSTLATVKRETNSVKWPIVMFVYMTTLAYLGAVLVQQLARFF